MRHLVKGGRVPQRIGRRQLDTFAIEALCVVNVSADYCSDFMN
jgi:hypothetical protein